MLLKVQYRDDDDDDKSTYYDCTGAKYNTKTLLISAHYVYGVGDGDGDNDDDSGVYPRYVHPVHDIYCHSPCPTPAVHIALGYLHMSGNICVHIERIMMLGHSWCGTHSVYALTMRKIGNRTVPHW